MISTTHPELADVLRLLFDLRLRDVHTALPGKVDSYDASKQTVDVLPQVQLYVRQEDGTEVAKPLPLITHCPVVFPGAGGFRLTFPIQKGDTVLLLFAESSIDRWLQNGDNADPQDQRRHHLTDGIALPGMHPDNAPWSKASTSGATIGKDGGPQVVFRDDMIELGGDDDDVPNDFVALASLVKSQTQKVIDALKSTNDTIKSNNTTLKTHTHTVAEAVAIVSTDLESLEDPSTPGDAGDVASSVVKSK